jgi:transposase
MANQLSMAQQETVLTLLGQGWSRRKIARELGLHRDTVRRYARQAERPSGAPATDVAPGSGAAATPKQATPIEVATGSEGSPAPSAVAQVFAAALLGTRPSKCDPFRSVIETKIAAGLTAQRIYQDLSTEHGFPGAYNSVKRFVHRLRAGDELPFRRIECEPGAEAQIDFGTGAPVSAGPEGQRRRTHVLRLVLSHSRKGYSEVFFRQTTDNLLACCENAFAAWGAVPKTLVVDNLKAAVLRADWYDPDLHPRINAFCTHYGTVLLPTKARTPRHKGKIEAGIKYVQSNALQGRVFDSLAAQNAHLARWESRVADLRIHGTTKKQVRQIFEEIERPAPQHIASKKIALIESGATELLRRARLVGPQTARWAEAMLKERGIEGVRVLVGLLSLVRKHSRTAIERACDLAVGHGAFRLRELRALISEPVEQQQLEFMAEHAVIRSIKAYGALVQVSFDQEEPWREPPIAQPTGVEER